MPIWWSTEPNSSNNWDLEAVVRGCCLPAGPESAFDTFSALKEEESIDLCGEDLLSFPDLTAKPASLHELEELGSPFFARGHNQQQQLLLSPRKSSPSASASSEPLPLASSLQPQRSLSQTPRSKRSRKKQQKKVVCEIRRDAASSDMWAWRKYGQKPIKGSPYPRGYYRCSSSKACLARKQVERSRADPAMLVITYTSEHNHPVPTHRNSLAGSTRNKLPPAPTTPPTASAEGDRRRQLQQQSEEVDGDVGGEEEGSLTVGNMEMVREDEMLFMDLGAATFADSTLFVDDADFPNHFLSQPWKIDNSNSAVASCSW